MQHQTQPKSKVVRHIDAFAPMVIFVGFTIGLIVGFLVTRFDMSENVWWNFLRGATCFAIIVGVSVIIFLIMQIVRWCLLRRQK